jgi:outer membrane receptor protein involved in Fe transport
LGLTHQFGDTGFSSRIETFYKNFHDPKKRFENILNSIVLLPELMSDRVVVVPEEARARGIETTLRYRPHDNLNLWLSYTRASADDKIDGRWRQRGWDQRHTVSSGIVWDYRQWLFSGSLFWHSGWQTIALPTYVGEDEQPQLYRNKDRLPQFLSMDFRVSRTWEWPRQTFMVFLEVTNATNRENVGAYEYELKEDEENGGFFVIAEEETLLPLVPSLGFQWSFN